MSKSVLVVRWYLGLWMLFWGFNWFLRFVPQPMGIKSNYLHVAFMQSGLFSCAKLLEIALGLALLANRAVPPMLVVVFPVTVMVAFIDLWVESLWRVKVWGLLVLLSHLFLLLAYARYYRPALRWKAEPGMTG